MPTYTIPLLPIPAARVKTGRYGAYYPARYAEFRRLAAPLLKRLFKDHTPLTGALKVGATILRPRPKSTDRAWPIGDIDNYLKAVFDACNGVVWVDDDQITKLGESEKRFARKGEQPKIILRVSPA